MHLFKFAVTVKHDNGTVTIKTTASTEQGAKNNVMLYENCPETAITKVKTLKQYY